MDKDDITLFALSAIFIGRSFYLRHFCREICGRTSGGKARNFSFSSWMNITISPFLRLINLN